MASYQRFLKNKLEVPFLVRACARRPARTHAHRRWLRKGTHTVSRVCVALCVVARAMKQNHSRRKVHFAQRTLNCTTDTQAVKFHSSFSSFPTAEHVAFKPKSKPASLVFFLSEQTHSHTHTRNLCVH